MSSSLAVVLALPWIIIPIVTIIRGRHSTSLDSESSSAVENAELVSVVIPARNEERNIARCVESALASTYPNLEVIAVNDHSSDRTGEILEGIAAGDARLRVITPEPLPQGWFGKQWACSSGFAHARGKIIGFMDADTWQTPDLVTRIANGMHSRSADMLTVAGTQVLGSFWERVIQPQVFGILATRYGGTEDVNNSKHAINKIANGQCLFVKREPYESLGGHGAVRSKVAEDLAFAQLYFTSGLRSFVVLGMDQLFTRMYTSFGELVKGWGKNVYAGGRDAMFGGRIGFALYPGLLLTPAILPLLPFVVFLFAAFGGAGAALVLWAKIVAISIAVWFAILCVHLRISVLYALLYPIGSAALLYILGRAVVRGSRVEWKDRDYLVEL